MKAWLGVFALVAACYSMSTLQEPKPLPAGAVRGAVGGTAMVTRRGGSLQFGLRVGLGAGTEMRLKLQGGIPGVEAGINVQPWDSEYVGIFLMPHYRFYRVMEDYDNLFDESPADYRRIQAFSLPTLVVFHLEPTDLFVGPDLTAGTRDRRGFLGVGGHAGVALAVGRHVHFILEGGLLSSVAGPRRYGSPNYGYDEQVLTVGRIVAEGALSISFGSKYLN